MLTTCMFVYIGSRTNKPLFAMLKLEQPPRGRWWQAPDHATKPLCYCTFTPWPGGIASCVLFVVKCFVFQGGNTYAGALRGRDPDHMSGTGQYFEKIKSKTFKTIHQRSPYVNSLIFLFFHLVCLKSIQFVCYLSARGFSSNCKPWVAGLIPNLGVTRQKHFRH